MPVLQKIIILYASAMVLTGCAGHYPEKSVPVASRPPANAVVDKQPARPDFYVVQKGDSLPSIARRFGIAQQSLADWNGIPPPYKVRAGRVLQLYQPKQDVRPDSNKQGIVKIPIKKRDYSQKKSTNSIASTNVLKLYWHWPLKGSILKPYSAEGNKGIDIAGKIGQTVRAAEAGKVVYSGDGLVGYGHLLIIKHNDVYLSAYANNSKLLVTEGATVDKDQAIAELGSVGSEACLHFEIRKNGSPVDPVKYLPEK